MAAEKPFERQPASGHRSMDLDRLQGVFRASRRKSATGGGSKEKGFCGGDEPAVQSDAIDENALRCVHCRCSFNNPAFRRVVKKSFSTPAKPLSVMDFRATKTRSTAVCKSCSCVRNASRNRRR